MAMTVERRLEKISGGLSPSQVVLVWLADAQDRFDWIDALGEELAAHQGDGLPLDRLMNQVEANVRAAHGGRTDPLTDRAVRSGIREAAGLWYLALEMNLLVAGQERVQRFADSAAENALTVLRLTGAPIAECQRWVAFVSEVLTERYALMAAVEQLCLRAFGRSPLFADAAVVVDGWNASGEKLVADYEVMRVEANGRGRSRRPKLDLAMIRERAAGEPAHAVTEAAIDAARERRHVMLGDHLRTSDGALRFRDFPDAN